jgi:hypothetical protein
MRPELVRNHLLPVEPLGAPRNIKRDGDENAGQEGGEEEYHLKEGMLDDLSMAGSGDSPSLSLPQNLPVSSRSNQFCI